MEAVVEAKWKPMEANVEANGSQWTPTWKPNGFLVEAAVEANNNERRRCLIYLSDDESMIL
jgi:hypothetical protein